MKTTGEFEREFIETAKSETGKSLEEWLAVVKESGLSKEMEILNMLKAATGLNHMQARFVAGIFLNNGQPVYQDTDSLLNNQFAKSEGMRPLFGELTAFIFAEFPDAQLVPKKTYLSFTAAKEFAGVNIKPKEIRLGLDLGNQPFEGVIQKAKLSGPMPRISHMMTIAGKEDIGPDLLTWLQASYNRQIKK